MTEEYSKHSAVSDFHYAPARAVVIDLYPPGGWDAEPVIGEHSSVSATRMGSLMPQWRRHMSGANAWWTAYEYNSKTHCSHVPQILLETGAELVVTLGREVLREVAGHPVDDWPFLEERAIDWRGRQIRVLPLPHPSGRCRFWNEPANRTAAGAALMRSLFLTETPRKGRSHRHLYVVK